MCARWTALNTGACWPMNRQRSSCRREPMPRPWDTCCSCVTTSSWLSPSMEAAPSCSATHARWRRVCSWRRITRMRRSPHRAQASCSMSAAVATNASSPGTIDPGICSRHSECQAINRRPSLRTNEPWRFSAAKCCCSGIWSAATNRFSPTTAFPWHALVVARGRPSGIRRHPGRHLERVPQDAQ